ncbi:hypothetical protein VR010_01115 [Actinomycetaceae bacterium L2_0104]
MNRIARLLPLLTTIAWAATLVVPVLDSGNTEGPRIVVTSLGGRPFDLDKVEAVFVLAWISVLGCAISGWILRSLRWWSVTTMLVAGALGTLLASMIRNPPIIMWDGVDAQGRMTGGAAIGEPAIGALIWAIGIVALLVAGVCGLVGATRLPAGR